MQEMREAQLAGGPVPTITLQQLHQLAQADPKLVEHYLPAVAYPDRLPEFAQGLSAVAEAGGYTLGRMQARFSNILLDQIFASVFSPPP